MTRAASAPGAGAFLNPNLPEIQALVRAALAEDVGPGDVTSEALVPRDLAARATVVAQAAGIVAGLPLLQAVFARIDPDAFVQTLVQDGAAVRRGQPLARVFGAARALLAGERTAVNFLQRLSGVATLTRRFVDATRGARCLILDTRKTTPGLRLLEKYAVRAGGGHNHRIGLYDQALVKDNHIALMRRYVKKTKKTEFYREIVKRARKAAPAGSPVEIEVETPEEALAAAAAGADIVLLDNMTLPAIRRTARRVRILRRRTGSAAPLLEVSGGVTLSRVRSIAAAGVDRISVGAITHSAPALDISMMIEPMDRGTRRLMRNAHPAGHFNPAP